MKNKFESMCKNISEKQELMDSLLITILYMKKSFIDLPGKIEIYFVESNGYLVFPDEYSEIGTKLDKILMDIRSSNSM